MLEKAPHAYFKAEFPSAVSAKEEISRLLTSHLSSRFGAVEAGLRWPWALRTVQFRLDQKLIWVGWYRNRRKMENGFYSSALVVASLYGMTYGEESQAYTPRSFAGVS